MERLGIGIQGAGWVAGEHIQAYMRNPYADVVAICSRTTEGARAKMEETGVSSAVYDDYEEMLSDPSVDVVSICTPNDLHAREGILAAQAGKHILMEKPIALTLDELRDLQAAVRAAGVKSVVSFVLRWNPLFQTIKAQVSDGIIGRVFYAEVDYYHGVGPWYKQFMWNVKADVGGSSLLSAGCHAVDGLRWFVEDEIVEVMAYSTRGDGEPFDQFEYDPTEVLIARFADGAVGKVGSCLECKMPYEFRIQLFGTAGTIRNNEIYAKETYPGQTDFVTVPTILPDSGDVTHHPFQAEIDHLVDCIRNDVESHASIDDATKTHEVVLAADFAARMGRPVRLPLL